MGSLENLYKTVDSLCTAPGLDAVDAKTARSLTDNMGDVREDMDSTALNVAVEFLDTLTKKGSLQPETAAHLVENVPGLAEHVTPNGVSKEAFTEQLRAGGDTSRLALSAFKAKIDDFRVSRAIAKTDKGTTFADSCTQILDITEGETPSPDNTPTGNDLRLPGEAPSR